MTAIRFIAWETRPGIVFVALVNLFLVGCKSGKIPDTAGPFPPSGEVADWTKASATRTFEADKLWEYIDGDAERYIQAGVTQTLTSDYKLKDQVDAVADIYVMTSAEGASKVLEAEPSLGSQPANVGEAARLYPASLVFRKGRYLVRLVAYEELPGIDKALLELGQAIDKRL